MALSLLLEPSIELRRALLAERGDSLACVGMVVADRGLRGDLVEGVREGHLGGVVDGAFEQAHGDLRAVGELAGQIEGGADTADLEAAVAADPSDLQSLHQLALHKVVNEDYDTAMDLLLQLMQQDRGYGDDAGRVALLKVFDLLGDDPRVGPYRRRMASLLY